MSSMKPNATHVNFVTPMMNNDIVREQLWKLLEERLNKPIQPGELQIIPLRWGAGKTHSLCKHVSMVMNSIIFTKEHSHIENEILFFLTEKFSVPTQSVHHWKGFRKSCESLNYRGDDKNELENKNKIEKLLEMGVNEKDISNSICGNCECYYKRQFRDVIHEGIVVSPNEFIRHDKSKEFVHISVDENIEKWEEIRYFLDESKIEDITSDDTAYFLSQNYMNYIENYLIYRKKFPELRKFLLEFNTKVRRKFIGEHFHESGSNVLYREEKTKEAKFTYLTHIDTILDEDDIKWFHQLDIILDSELLDILYRVRIHAIRNLNKEIIDITTLLLGLKETISYAFFPVIINEKIVKTSDGFRSEMGQNYGTNKRCFFAFYKPQIFHLFDLLTHGKSIKWVTANFNKELFDIYLKQYKKYQEIRQLVFGDSAYFEIKPIVEQFDIDLPLNKAAIWRVKRTQGGSWSKSSLNKKDWHGRMVHESIFADYVKHLLNENTGLISFKELHYLDSEGNYKGNLRELLDVQNEWLERHFLYWGGRGIEGSNLFKDYKRLVIVGTPNIPESELILNYIRLFHSIPNFVGWDAKRKKITMDKESIEIQDGKILTGYKDDKMDLIYTILVEIKIMDAINRLRNLEDTNKEIILMCNLPEIAKSHFEDIREIDMDDLLVLKLSEDESMTTKILDMLRQGGIYLNEFSKKHNLQKRSVKKLIEYIAKNADLCVVYDYAEKKMRLKR